jgi:aconitate hydratase
MDYLNKTNRQDMTNLAKKVYEQQYLFRHDPAEEPEYSSVVELDLGTIDSTLAGPKRPQDRVAMRHLKNEFLQALTNPAGLHGFGLNQDQLDNRVKVEGMDCEITHGSVAIAAITSCTNTSNPSVLIGAGLLAKNAVEKGLSVKPYVKTSLAPGSQVVTQYLERSGLLHYLEALKFNIVGYGCTTCIGNSGPLDQPIKDAINEGNLVVSSVSSGNRNFEGRINPDVKANYLASPIHVVAYALAGNIAFDPDHDIIGQDQNGNDVYLKDVWPSNQSIAEVQEGVINSQMFEKAYGSIMEGTEDWQKLASSEGRLYEFDENSTYIQCPPFFENFTEQAGGLNDIKGARVLLKLGDSVTTDHISPAGAIPKDYPAGRYLQSKGIKPKDFNSYGSRRGNHEVMMRGTFANIRIRNLLVPGTEGGVTVYHPDGSVQYVYDAAMKYKEQGMPLIVLAGKEYGTGSSRDWAAKGTYLLGVRAVIAESYERIHRSNLVGMGVLPLQFYEGETADSIGLDGTETFNIKGLNNLKPRCNVKVEAIKSNGETIHFDVRARLDTDVDVDYMRNGGILQTVMKDMLESQQETS